VRYDEVQFAPNALHSRTTSLDNNIARDLLISNSSMSMLRIANCLQPSSSPSSCSKRKRKRTRDRNRGGERERERREREREREREKSLMWVSFKCERFIPSKSERQ